LLLVCVRKERWGGGEKESIITKKSRSQAENEVFRIPLHIQILTISPLLHSLSGILSGKALD